MKEEDYLGVSRDKDKNFKHSTPRPARKLGMACVSKIEVCDEKNKHCLGIKVFKQIFKEKNLSLFSPKKDRCDICIEQENGNIDSSIWSKHIEDKEKARKEKTEIRRKL
ncbi:unnamed protein product [Acanthoscelides obtectus]|uniref:Uncharacterized protein n=1 Tax=Acanthoscelides obtectus TaxID=200917 RepID=A0A9P0LH87_ACAOB|nr:unnamed protein product [Acanthoscelides obtectus]CAK1641040.1 hypothetical protein AOBTE_LOCUS12104 [Acanthoscelides obtectus]